VKENYRIWLVAIALILTGSLAPASAAASPASLASEAPLVASDASKDVLFQESTITALMQGVFNGSMTFSELGKHGDFGIGTFEGLDGEMVELDGQFYQVKADGKVYPVNGSMETPFADVTFFEPDLKISINNSANQTELQKYLEAQIPSPNIFYAIRIDGTFDYVKTRSVPAQNPPYPTLTEAVAHQSVFEFHNQSGTIVGFWSPAYANGANVPGYHFHFLNENRTAGGHVLDFTIKNASVAIDYTPQFFMNLPADKDFLQEDLTGSKEEDLQKVESNPDKAK